MPRHPIGALRTWLAARLSRDTSLSRPHAMLRVMGRPNDAPPSLDPGAQVGGYTIEERIGLGGFGEVFRARQPVIGRAVAIKVLHERYSSDPEAVARFIAEARAVNRISHA